MSPAEVAALAQHVLDTHHVFLHREMAPLREALRGAPEDIRRDWDELHQVLDEHLMKEEVILFPSILALAGGDVSTAMHVIGPIPQMKVDHERIRAIEARLRAEAPRAGDASQALLVLLDDLAQHAHVEDTELFPAALAMLPGTPDLEAIEAAATVAAQASRPPRPPPPRPRAPEAPARKGLLGRVLERVRRG